MFFHLSSDAVCFKEGDCTFFVYPLKQSPVFTLFLGENYWETGYSYSTTSVAVMSLYFLFSMVYDIHHISTYFTSMNLTNMRPFRIPRGLSVLVLRKRVCIFVLFGGGGDLWYLCTVCPFFLPRDVRSP